MDICFLYDGQQFISNSEKAASNVVRHGVTFEVACQVFFDPLIRVQDAGDDDEERQAAVGLTEDWRVLFVVHMVRESEVIRLISARAATAQERRAYEDDE